MTNHDTPTMPADEHVAGEDDHTVEDYRRANDQGAELRDRILADPAGRGGYDWARAQIERHQANLTRVRKLRSLAQATVAEAMGMDQSEISRLERRTDLLLSTLRRFVEATGGELHLVASYPDEGDIELLVDPTR
ncbi:MAG: helix-turn-helix domain-containing protein [Actinomycetota bacterium]|nr:helix-turn-helix domain-containing protein [Actinomycetota bacterium]